MSFPSFQKLSTAPDKKSKRPSEPSATSEPSAIAALKSKKKRESEQQEKKVPDASFNPRPEPLPEFKPNVTTGEAKDKLYNTI